MSGPRRIVFVGLLLIALGSSTRAAAQTARSRAEALDLQEHYDAAVRYQQAGDLDSAVHEYQLFLSQTLDQLAVGEARLTHYEKAGPIFERALSLDPNVIPVKLDYAQAELSSGSLSQAEALSRQVVQQQGASTEEIARAHEILGRTLLRMNRDQEARAELEAAASIKPSFDHSYNLAIACLDLDDAVCASRIFSGLETAYGDKPGIHMDFGRAWGQSDFQPRAEAEFRKAIEEDPKIHAAHYCLAVTYLQENEASKIKDAEAELEKELVVSPGDFLTYAALGKIAADQNKFVAAARYLHRAVQLNPKSPDAYLYLGQMYFDSGQWSSSEAALRRAILLTTDPSHNRYQIQRAHYILGRILMRQGKKAEASAEMKIAQTFLRNDLGQDRSKLNGMLGSPGQGVEIASPDPDADSSAAADPDEVRKVMEFRQAVASPLADSYNNMGVIAAVRKDYASASIFFEQAAKWDPSMPGIDLNWGRAAFDASRYADAIGPLTRYLRVHPTEQKIRTILSISQYMTGDYQGCIANLQGTESGIKSVPQVSFVYGDSLVKTGHSRTGVEILRALEEKNPEIPDVHRALGEAYVQAGNRPKAIDEFREALQLNPEDQRARDGLEMALTAKPVVKATVPTPEEPKP